MEKTQVHGAPKRSTQPLKKDIREKFDRKRHESSRGADKPAKVKRTGEGTIEDSPEEAAP